MSKSHKHKTAERKFMPWKEDLCMPNGSPCPTPHKTAFASKDLAKKVLRDMKHRFVIDRFGNTPKPYYCACGVWHLGHPPGGKRPPVELRPQRG